VTLISLDGRRLDLADMRHLTPSEIAKLGHTTRMIAAHYVKPFVKRQKNDAADAEAIYEAA